MISWFNFQYYLNSFISPQICFSFGYMYCESTYRRMHLTSSLFLILYSAQIKQICGILFIRISYSNFKSSDIFQLAKIQRLFIRKLISSACLSFWKLIKWQNSEKAELRMIWSCISFLNIFVSRSFSSFVIVYFRHRDWFLKS